MTLYSVSMCTFMTSSFLVRYLVWFLPLLQLSWRLKQEGEVMKDAMPAFLVPPQNGGQLVLSQGSSAQGTLGAMVQS